jgi:hypothetical protein
VKNRNPKQKLLDDVFANDVEPSLGTVRRMARHRRWFRYGRMGAMAMLAAFIGCLLIREKHAAEKQNVASAPAPTDFVTASSPLAPGFVVRTDGDAVAFVHTEAFQLLVVTTEPNATKPEIIDDERLLRFAPGAVLVHISGGSADLVFPDQTGLSSQRPSAFE